MSTSKLLKWSVGIIFLLFAISFGSIILFGVLDNSTANSPSLFKTIYFVFVLVILGIVYFTNTDLLTTKIEHALIIVSILIFSAGIATLMGSVKTMQEDGYYSAGGSDGLQAQRTYYSQQVNSMASLEKMIISNNRILEKEVEDLTAKLNNRTPIVVETIVTIPAEIIYEEEIPPVEDYEEYEDEEDEEEDD